MTPRRVLWMAGLLLVSMSVAMAAETTARHSLVVLFAPELEGKLEPCGCSARQLGGLSRMAALARELAGEAEKRGDAALVKQGRQHDPECVECHVVGLREHTGFRDPKATPNLAGVGCEMCHGPGNVHGRYTDRPYGRVHMPRCERCHDDEHDPDYDAAKAYEKIKHWKQRTGADK